MSNKTAVKLIEFLKPRLNRRSVAFFLCLVLSGLFWLLTSLSEEYVDEVSIPVAYENLPEDLLIANRPITVVRAEVKGFGFSLLWHWLKFNSASLNILANPTGMPSTTRNGEEMHYVLAQEKTGNLSFLGDDRIEVLRIYPDTLFIKFRPMFRKRVPVRLDAQILCAKQFGLSGAPAVDPDTITLSGLKADVEKIDHITTEKQSWTDLDESLTAEVPLIGQADTQLVRMSHQYVQVAINVSQFTEGSVTIPINVRASSGASVKVYPSEVEVKYQLPLADYEKVTAEMFRASVTLDAQNDGQLLTVELDELPVQVRQARVIPAQVEYIVQK